MLTCIFAKNRNSTAPYDGPYIGHRKERQSHENPD